MNHTRKLAGRSYPSLLADVLWSSLKYNISLLEYFQFRFFELSDPERARFAGTGYMYEYQLAMNPKVHRAVLEDKRIFLKAYAPFIRHDHASLDELQADPAVGERLLANSSGKIVLKGSHGQCGRGVEVRPCSDFTPQSLVQRMVETENDLAEEFIEQHPDIMALSPSGLNTVRIITQLNARDEVEILGARLRITVDSIVDNLAAGNLAAPIQLETGRVDGPGVYSDITKSDESVHPVTGLPIVGFQVPYWEETLDMVRRAALLNTSNRSIGWDVAITADGPELVEGNHDWCKLLWQLPVKSGLKPVLDQHLKTIT